MRENEGGDDEHDEHDEQHAPMIVLPRSRLRHFSTLHQSDHGPLGLHLHPERDPIPIQLYTRGRKTPRPEKTKYMLKVEEMMMVGNKVSSESN